MYCSGIGIQAHKFEAIAKGTQPKQIYSLNKVYYREIIANRFQFCRAIRSLTVHV